MARNIRLDQIDDFCRKEVEELVKETTLAWHGELKTREARSSGGVGTPVDTGRLINSWQVDVSKKFEGRIFSNLEYAEAVAYGEGLPPSWGGRYRTRQGTTPGYPDLIGKEIATKYVPKIREDIRRRRG